jgi:hypothetical protein
MEAKAAKGKPGPKEPKGPRVRSHVGRFVGVRVSEDEVPRLPVFPAQWAIDDPRQRPYLVIWGKGAYALKMAVSEGGKAIVVTLTGGESRRIPIFRRQLPKGSGTSLFYVCPWCRSRGIHTVARAVGWDRDCSAHYEESGRRVAGAGDSQHFSPWQGGECVGSPSARRHALLDHPSGGSQATVPMSAGTETSRSSRSLDAAVSLCRRPPGM